MSRRFLLACFLAAAAATLIAVLLPYADPLGLLGPCPLRAWTGIPCPTCHGTQALRGLIAGDWRSAFAANPLAALLLLLLPAGGLLALLALPFASRLPRPRRVRARNLLLPLVGLLAANWLYLLLSRR